MELLPFSLRYVFVHGPAFWFLSNDQRASECPITGPVVSSSRRWLVREK